MDENHWRYKTSTRTFIHRMSRVNTAVYRATGGRLGNRWRVGSAWNKPVDMCLLTTTGRKSGRQITAPLLFMRDGDTIVLVASQGGLPAHPGWLYNIRANPHVVMQIGSEIRPMTAVECSPQQRERLWPQLVDLYADFEQYQQMTTERTIPVVVCSPL